MGREVAALVGVKFISRKNDTNTLSKEYIYKVDEKLLTRLEAFDLSIENMGDYQIYYTFTIENENGFCYQNSNVIITRIIYDKKERHKISSERQLYFLNKVLFSGTIKIKNKKISNLSTNTNNLNDPSVNSINNLEGTFKNGTFTVTKATKSFNKEYNEKRKGETMLEKIMPDVEFGKVTGLEMSLYGPAFKGNDYRWFSYDNKNKEWVDVTGMTFDFSITFKMPVALTEVKPNDFIFHNGSWVRVVNVETTDGSIVAEKIFAKEIVSIIPTKNLFGFNFVTKLVYLGVDTFSQTANESNPFGNMLPLLLLGDSSSSDNMLPLIMMMQGGNIKFDFSNPLMLYMMMKDSDSSDNLMPLLLMNPQMTNWMSPNKTESENESVE